MINFSIKYFIAFNLVIIISFACSNIIGVEYTFEDILDIVSIPKINKKQEVINKDIYYKYHVFVYSNPVDILKKESMQRFKEVKDKGKYVYNGKKGEFFILGTNYQGEYVYNVHFPVDFIPESMPEKWNLLYYKSFENSWNYNYKYKEQLDYMKETKLLFDRINLVNKTCDSYDLIEYNISANKIGLGKLRLNTPATWKTMGIVSARRKLKNGNIREVIFATNPMSADVNIKSSLDVIDNVEINEDEESKEIEINFGSKAVNLSKYAKAEHIKNITSKLYINGEYIDSVSGSKTIDVDKKIKFIVSRIKNNFKSHEYVLNVEVRSYLYTEFLVDGLIYDNCSKNIFVKVAPKKLVPINNINLKLFKKNNEDMVVSPLVQTINSQSSNSSGIIEKGRNLAILLDLNIPKEYIKNIVVLVNSKINEYSILKYDNNYLVLSIDILDKFYISIATWKTLRNITGSIFNVDESDIGKRIEDPNVITVILYLNVNDKAYEYTALLDVIDEYYFNINYRFIDDILNYEELNSFNEL